MLRDARVNMVVQQSIRKHGWLTSGSSEISLIERHWTEEEWGSRKGTELQQLSDPPELLMNLNVPAGTSFSDGDHLRGNESDVIRFHHRKWMVLDGNNRRSGVDAAIASGKLDKKWCYPAVVVASVDPKDPLAIADLAGECNFVRSQAQHDTLLDRIRCLQRYMPVFKSTNPKGTRRGWRKDFVTFMLEETAVGANNHNFLGSAEVLQQVVRIADELTPTKTAWLTEMLDSERMLAAVAGARRKRPRDRWRRKSRACSSCNACRWMR